jgi:hypothetical protein
MFKTLSNRLPWLPVCLLTLLLAAWLWPRAAQAQHVWEYEPRRGERRFNQFTYKASHNSYERSESLASQMDAFNCWCLELDLWWYNGDIRVSHTCPTDSHDLLSTKLSRIASSDLKYDRVTVIYLEMKEGCFTTWPSRTTYRNYIQTRVEQYLGADRIYTSGMFANPSGDNFRWPSYQELVRRGKNFIVILHEPDRSVDSSFFFGVHFSNPFPPDGLDVPYKVLYNVGDAGATPSGFGDRYLARTYPDGAEDTCQLQEWSDYWDRGISRGFNFVATNCVGEIYTITDPRTHSPAPLFVAHDLSLPEMFQTGVRSFPYSGAEGLLRGIQRASPMVDVRIETGTYNITNGTVLKRPVVLKAQGGTVLIR